MTAVGTAARAGAVWAAGGIAVSTAAVLLSNLLLVARAPAALYGDVAVLTVAVLLLGTLFRVGADRIFIGEVQVAAHRGAGLLGFSLVAGVVGGLLIASGAGGAVIDRALSTPLTGTERWLLGAWLAADTTRLVVAEAHRSVDRVRMAAVAGTGLRSPLYLGLLVALVVVQSPPHRVDVLLVSAVASVAVLVVSLMAIATSYAWWHANPLASSRLLWRGHSSMLVTTAAATVIGAFDVYLVGAAIGSEQAARYAFSVSLVGGVAIVDTALSLGLSPTAARGISTGDCAGTERLIVRYTRVGSALAAVLYGLLLLLAQPIGIALGGEDYRGVLPLVALLGAGQLLGVLLGPGGSMLILAREYRVITVVTVSTAVLMVAATSAAGFLGDSLLLVAAASGAATALLHALGAGACRRRLGMTVHVIGPTSPSRERA